MKGVSKVDERLNVLDVAGASLTLIGALVERYIKDGYCDPIMMNALKGATELAKHFQQEVSENFEHHQDQDLVDGVTELLVNLQVTIIEAGEVMNRVIEDNGLPVKLNTFELDTEHPNYNPDDHTDCDHD
jgi:hypothetical protein